MRSIRLVRDWREADLLEQTSDRSIYPNGDAVALEGGSRRGLIRRSANGMASRTLARVDAGLALASPVRVLAEGGDVTVHADGFALPDIGRVAGRPLQIAFKRALDVIGAGLGLLILSPLLIALALLIRTTSKGPVFFRQKRIGLDNRPFEILKFRSMYTDRCDITGVSQTVRDDPRVTPIGRVMRRTNLDELPQLINVLRGEMSLVGPRPHVPGMLAAGLLYEDLVPGYDKRHLMRPGITGLAQVRGLRGPTIERQPAVDRVISDLTYVRDFTIWLDVKILVRTVVSELRGGTGS